MISKETEKTIRKEMSGVSGHNGYYLKKSGERVNDLLSRQFIVPTLDIAPTIDTLSWADGEYGGIIDAIVTYKYPNDKMQSVINNYLLDPTGETIVKEFNEMQAWRKEAKEIAKQALEYELH